MAKKMRIITVVFVREENKAPECGCGILLDWDLVNIIDREGQVVGKPWTYWYRMEWGTMVLDLPDK